MGLQILMYWHQLPVCACMCSCMDTHTLCDVFRGFCPPSGNFFEFQQTMVMFILDTWPVLMFRNQVATWQLAILLLSWRPSLLAPFPPFSSCRWHVKTVQFQIFSFLTCHTYSISLSGWFLARTYCQHCWLCPGEQVVTNQFLWQICTGSQLPFNNLRLHPQACHVAVCEIRIPVSLKTTRVCSCGCDLFCRVHLTYWSDGYSGVFLCFSLAVSRSWPIQMWRRHIQYDFPEQRQNPCCNMLVWKQDKIKQ